MTLFKTAFRASRIDMLVIASALVAGSALPASAIDTLPPQASQVRTTLVAMTLADAARTAADVSTSARSETQENVPASSTAMKPEVSRALAQARPARAVRVASYERAPNRFHDPRWRPYRDPFVLIVGIAY